MQEDAAKASTLPWNQLSYKETSFPGCQADNRFHASASPE